MKALVTGAAGFIGSHLAERAARRGADVVGLDCFTDYYPRAIKEAQSRSQPAARRASGSSRARIQDADLPSLLDGVTHVFHLAAQAGVRKSWGRDFSDLHRRTTSRRRSCCSRRASGAPLERFVYASSSSVYGDNAAMPMREDALPQPVSPYGVTKLAAEQLCYLYHVNYGVPTVVAALLHGLRPAPAARHGVPPVHPRRARSASRSRSTATASRRATSRSSPTPSRQRSRPATAACRAAPTTSAAARGSRSTRCSR